MRILGVIQARMGSKRLPGKALTKIAGRTPIEWIFRRLSACRRLDGVVLSTSDAPDNDPLARHAAKIGLRTFRGPERDLILRFLGTLEAFGGDAMVRVTADCPLVDPGLVDAMASAFRAKAGRVDFLTNTFPPSHPDGLDLDLLPRKTLERLDKEVRDPLHREWLTTYVMNRPRKFRILNLPAERDESALRWTLDYPEDLRFLRAVFGRLAREGDGFSRKRVMSLLEERPSLARINLNRVDKVVRRGIRSGVYHALALRGKTRTGGVR